MQWRHSSGHPWKLPVGHPWMSWQQIVPLVGGRWTKEAPCFKEIAEIGNGIKMGDGCGQWRILGGTGHALEAMDDLVFWSRQRYGAVVMPELDRVQDDLTLGVTLDQLEAPV